MKGLIIAGVMLATSPAHAPLFQPPHLFSAIPVQASTASPATVFQLREDQKQQQAAAARRKQEEHPSVVNPSAATCAGHPEWIVCQHR